MPITRTKALAKKLGLLKKRKIDSCIENTKKRRKGQFLSYVIVIDFESTCWKERKGAQEIIEFPAVLLDVHTGAVVEEFQQYVQPHEIPTLSNFCKELTGITQVQVDNGVPLATCLFLFSKWLKELKEQRGLCLMEPGHQYRPDRELCALATWTDWDLGVCLHFECRRKQIRKPTYFDQWIDLRKLYQHFYGRKPTGLGGSLEDLGISFTGRQHCGLDDARNTAKLCYRLVKDGCQLIITKCLQKKTIQPPASCTTEAKENQIDDVVQNEQAAHLTASSSTSIAITTAASTSQSTTKSTVEVVEERKESEQGLSKDVEPSARQAKDHNFLHEGESQDWGWGAGEDDDFLEGVMHELDAFERAIDFEQIANSHTPKQNLSHASQHNIQCTVGHYKDQTERVKISGSGTTPSRTQCIPHIAPVTLLPPSNVCVKQYCPDKSIRQDTNNISLSKQHGIQKVSQLSDSTNYRTRATIPESPISACAKTEKQGEGSRVEAAVSGGFCTPSTSQWLRTKNCSLSSIQHSPTPFNGGKLTPPLCNCGKRARRKVVTSPGHNQGKPFFSCSKGRVSGCCYFKWETPHSHNSLTFISNLSCEQ